MRRASRALVLAIVLTSIFALPAAAKMPPFTLEVSDSRPQPGQALTVTVAVEDADFAGATEEGHELTGLLGLFPVEEVGPDLRPLRPWPGEVEVALVHDGDVYRGEIVAPDDPGEYVLVPFPAVINYPSDDERLGYPDPLVLTVAPATSWPLRAAVPWGIAGLVVLLAATLLSRRDVARPI